MFCPTSNSAHTGDPGFSFEMPSGFQKIFSTEFCEWRLAGLVVQNTAKCRVSSQTPSHGFPEYFLPPQPFLITP